MTTLTTLDRAAVTAGLLALAALLAACSGEGTNSPTEPEPADPRVTTVDVKPASASLHAIGAAADFDATVRDQAGNRMSGVSVSWSVSADSVAAVDAEGTATAEANGSVIVEAEVEGVTGAARLRIDQEVAEVDLSPDAASVGSMGDTTRFTASVVDANGHPVAGATPEWKSTDTGVVTVSSDGVATARGEGRARVVVEAAGVADSASFSVDQQVARVTVSPDSSVVRELGATVLYEADARDAKGNPVSESLRWEVADPSIAAVDGDGRVEARGHGTTVVVVRAGDVADSAAFVADTVTPAVTSVGPVPLEAGSRAVIEGQNFGSDTSAVTVEVDGTPARVHAVRDERVEFTVPTFDCRPRREAQVVVSVDGHTAEPATRDLSPRGEPVSLAAGERRILQDPSGFCLQFEETPPDAAYLVGVQSISEVAATLTPAAVTVRATGDGSVSSSVAGARGAPSRAERGGRDGPRGPSIDEPARAQRSHRAAGVSPEVSSDAASSIGPSASVGDEVELTVPCLGDCAGPTPISGVITRIGDRVIWVRDTENEHRYAADELEAAIETFDNTVYPLHEEYFGTPTDLDDNGRTVIVVSRAVRRQGYSGFVWSVDWCGSCDASDNGEYAYIEPPHREGQGPSVSLVAHEFAHVVQVSERIKNDAPHFSPRFNEGQAQIAEELVGHALSGNRPGRDYGWETAVGDHSSFYWNFSDMGSYFGWGGRERTTTAPEECTWLVYGGNSDSGPCRLSLNYGVSWSLIRWMADHFGPDHPGGRKGFHRQMTTSSKTGFDLIEELTGTSVERVLAGWAASLYLDGRPVAKPDRWTNPSWNLRDVLDPHASYDPLPANRRGLGSSTRTELDVRAASSAYFRLSGPAEPGASVRVRSPGGGPLPDQMQVWVVRIR